MSAKAIVEKYFHHFARKEWGAARAMMHDALSFHGPIDRFQRADDLSAAQQRLGSLLERVDIVELVAEGDSVCVVWDMVTSTPIGTAHIAEVFHVSGGKIDRIRIFFDPRPFAALFGK